MGNREIGKFLEKNKPALRIEEALEFHKRNKKESEPNILKIDLGRVLFKGAKEKTISVNMSSLINGKTTRVDPKWVAYICERTGVDANFLFGIEPMSDKLKKEFYESD